MKDDPIISQIRAIRHQISEQYHHNPDEFIRHYIELEQRHAGRFVSLPEQKTPLHANHTLFEKRGYSDREMDKKTNTIA